MKQLVAEIHKELRNGFFTLFVIDENDNDRCLFKGSYHVEEEAIDRLRQEHIYETARIVRYY